MSSNNPILLKKATKPSGPVVYLIASKDDVAGISALGDLKTKVAERAGDDELVFFVPTAKDGKKSFKP